MIRFRTHDTHPLAMIETRSKQKTKENKEKIKQFTQKRDVEEQWPQITKQDDSQISYVFH